jgi:1,4-dihydroxy-2-naphthoyl-CoA hydrolase
MIWHHKDITLEKLISGLPKCMMDHLEIEFTEIGEDYLVAKMPVAQFTMQPHGLLHGGASLALAESLGSYAANLCLDNSQYMGVGLEINANHVGSARAGFVYGTSRPIHIGKSTQVWEIKIVDEKNKLICISRHTVAVIKKK